MTDLERFLEPREPRNSMERYEVKTTDYGFSVYQMTSFVTITRSKIFIYDDRTAKRVTKVDRNYSAPYQYTIYYDQNGNEIKSDDNNTRKELAEWKRLKKVIA